MKTLQIEFNADKIQFLLTLDGGGITTIIEVNKNQAEAIIKASNFKIQPVERNTNKIYWF